MKNKTEEKINDILERFSLKKTETRKKIISAFLTSKNSLSQADLLETLALHGENPDRVSIYRNLNQMKTTGLIHEVDFNQYIACTHDCAEHPHLLLFCTNCQKHQEIKDHKKLNDLLRPLQELNFFSLQTPLSIRGICTSCKTKKIPA